MKALRAIPWRTWDGEKHAKEDASPEEGHHAARHAKRLRRVIGSDRLAWQRCRWEELPLMNPAPGKCCSSPSSSSSSSSSSSAQIAGPKNIQHKLINWFLRLGHISHSLGRTKYIVIYRMHSGGSDQITNIWVYIPTSLLEACMPIYTPPTVIQPSECPHWSLNVNCTTIVKYFQLNLPITCVVSSNRSTLRWGTPFRE